jgi:hemerythrin-like metal-binding protein
MPRPPGVRHGNYPKMQGIQTSPNMRSSRKTPPGGPVRVFVLAPLAFAHSAADRFVRADARPNRVNWRPLGAISPWLSLTRFMRHPWRIKQKRGNRMNSKLIGQILIDNGMLTETQLNDGLQRQVNDNRMIGIILVEMGFVKKQELVDCLNMQISDLNNVVYSIIKNDFNKDADSLIDFKYYDENINELSYQTKKSWERIKLSTKIAIIDIQHIWLIMLSHYASMLFKTFEIKTKLDEIKIVLDLLISYAFEHFNVEETLLDIIKYDQNHYDQHKDFIRYFRLKIRNIHEAIDSNSVNANTVLNEICEYLNNWILSHIAIYDTGYAIFIAQQKNKEEIFSIWTNKLKNQKIAVITKRQKQLYDYVMKKE